MIEWQENYFLMVYSHRHMLSFRGRVSQLDLEALRVGEVEQQCRVHSFLCYIRLRVRHFFLLVSLLASFERIRLYFQLFDEGGTNRR
jgi:hypothetical protein